LNINQIPDSVRSPDEWMVWEERRRRRNWIAITVLVLGLLGAGAYWVSHWEERPLSAEEYLQRALEHEENGRLKAAAVDLKNAVQLAPQRAEARFRLGRVYLEDGLTKFAIKELELARELGLEDRELVAALAEAYIENHEYFIALSTLALAAPAGATIPGLPPAPETFVLTDERGLARQLNLAIEEKDGLRWAVAGTLDGAPVSSITQSGVYDGQPFLLQVKDHDGRWDFADAAIAGAHGTLEFARGAALYKPAPAAGLSGKDQPAREPRFAVLRGTAWLGVKELAIADAAFREALVLESGYAEAHIGLAKVALFNDHMEEAKHALERALALSPELAAAHRLKGELAASRSDHAAAQQHFERALKGSGRDILARVALGSTLLAQGKLDEAQTQVGILHKQVGDWPPALVLDAQIAKRRGDAAAMRTALSSALKVSPNYGPALFLMSALHRQNKEPEQAFTLIERLLRTRPHHLGAGILLTLLHLDVGDADRAINTAEAFLHHAPGDAFLLHLMGEAHALRGEDEIAARFFALAGKAHALRQEHEITARLFVQTAGKGKGDSAIRKRLALTHLLAGDWKEGFEVLGTALERTGTGAFESSELFQAQLARGDSAGALATAQQIAARNPGSARAATMLGMAAEARGDLRGARAHFELALTRDPTFALAAMHLARLDQRSGNLLDARQRYASVIESQRSPLVAQESYAQALARDPNDRKALLGLAELAKSRGDDARAVELLERARRAHPEELPARLLLARYYQSVQNWGSALTVAKELEALAPENPRVLQLLARLQRAAGAAGDAASTFQKLAALRPTDARAQYDLGTARAQRNDVDGAREAFTKAIELDPRHLPSKLALGVLETAVRDFATALAIAERIHREHPKSGAGEVLRGDVHLANRRLSEAAQAYERALAREPSGHVFAKLVRAHQAAGKPEAVLAVLRQWLASPSATIADLELMARIALAELSLPEISKEAYERILARRPEHATALNNLSWLYHQQGDDVRALELAQRANAADPGSAAAADTYGWLLLLRGEVPTGLRLVRQALTELPDNAEVRFHVAVGLSMAGERGKARKMLESIAGGRASPALRAKVEELLKQL
jgi:putative PEP-CTERM system TPR-repeat lipoprotein